jgi:hypothetical protein
MERETVIITISHRKRQIDENRHQNPQEFYKQEISCEWMDKNNPEMLRNIIAVINNLNSKDSNHGSK